MNDDDDPVAIALAALDTLKTSVEKLAEQRDYYAQLLFAELRKAKQRDVQ